MAPASQKRPFNRSQSQIISIPSALATSTTAAMNAVSLRHSLSAANLSIAPSEKQKKSKHALSADSGVKFSRQQRSMDWLVLNHQLETPTPHYKTTTSDFNISLPMKKSIHFGSCQVRDTSQFLFTKKEETIPHETAEMMRQKKRNSMLAVNSFSSPNIMKQFASNLEQAVPPSPKRTKALDPEEEENRLMEERRRARSVPLTRAAKLVKKRIKKDLIKQHQDIMIEQSLLYQERVHGQEVRKRRLSLAVITNSKPRKAKTQKKKKAKKQKDKENASPNSPESGCGTTVVGADGKTTLVTSIPQVPVTREPSITESSSAPSASPTSAAPAETTSAADSDSTKAPTTVISAPTVSKPAPAVSTTPPTSTTATPQSEQPETQSPQTVAASESSEDGNSTQDEVQRAKRKSGRKHSVISTEIYIPTFRKAKHPPAKPGSFSRSSSRDLSWLTTPSMDNPVGPGAYDVQPFFKRLDSTKIAHKIARPNARSERLSWKTSDTPYHTALERSYSSFQLEKPNKNTAFGSSKRRHTTDRKIEELWNVEIPPHVKRQSLGNGDGGFSILSEGMG